MVSFKVFNRKFRKFIISARIFTSNKENSIFRILFWDTLPAKSNIYFFQNFKTNFFCQFQIQFFLKKPQKCSKIFEANIKMHFIYEFFEAENFRNSVFHKKSILNTIFGSVDFKFLFKKKSFDPKPENL